MQIINTLSKIITPIINLLLQFIAILFIPISIFCVYFFSKTYGSYMYRVFTKKHTPIKKEKSTYIEHGLFKKIFIDFPSIYLHDLLTRNPNDFKEYGIHLFVGEQGCGKTITMAHMARRLKKQFPKCKLYCDFQFSYADLKIKSITEVGKYKNGRYGQIYMIDEILTDLNSKDSGNVPIEVLGAFCQQRKESSCIFSTAQVFSRVVKELREQTLKVYVPRTYFNCLTIVSVCKPSDYDYDKQVFKKKINTYWFVHDLDLRNCYDTYEKIVRDLKRKYNPRLNQEFNINLESDLKDRKVN